jgi:GNAT superfamily N-acetyltransferase
MDLRELTEADLPALHGLCARGLRDQVGAPVLRRLMLAEPGLRPELYLGLWDGPRLAGAALGSIRDDAAGRYGGPRLLVVDPDLRLRGHGGRLLAELEARLAAAGATRLRAGWIGPNYLWPGVDPRYTAAVCVLERRGYARVGEAVNMEVDLTARTWWSPPDEARLAAAGWAVRRATAEDAGPLGAWVRERFDAVWEWETLLALDAGPPAAFVAVRGAEIGGFACHSVSGLAGTFGPTGTAEELRGAGLGRALLLRCLADLREQGYERVEIGWVGPVGFYSRAAGAYISRVFWVYEKGAGPG